jgi:filamentous hemagglutinin
MAAGVGIDGSGNPRRVIGTSEPNGYLRPGVVLQPEEELARGNDHAEVNVRKHMHNQRITPTTIGAGRPICASCANDMTTAGARPATELKTPISGPPAPGRDFPT